MTQSRAAPIARIHGDRIMIVGHVDGRPQLDVLPQLFAPVASAPTIQSLEVRAPPLKSILRSKQQEQREHHRQVKGRNSWRVAPE